MHYEEEVSFYVIQLSILKLSIESEVIDSQGMVYLSSNKE